MRNSVLSWGEGPGLIVNSAPQRQVRNGSEVIGKENSCKGSTDGNRVWELFGITIGDTHGRNCCFSRLGA